MRRGITKSPIRIGLVISIFTILIFSWIVFGLSLHTNSAILVYNTEMVSGDEDKVDIEYVNSEGTVFLEDGSSVGTDEIDSYIRTCTESGMYYIPDGTIVMPIDESEARDMCVSFAFIDGLLCIVIIIALFFIRSKKLRWLVCILIGYFLVSVYGDIVWKLYCSSVVGSGIWIQWVLAVRYIVVASLGVLFRVIGKKMV